MKKQIGLEKSAVREKDLAWVKGSGLVLSERGGGDPPPDPPLGGG